MLIPFVVLITGPSEGGIGAQVATTLAHASPKRLLLLGRTESKVSHVIDAIEKINGSIDVKFIQVDLLSNGSVRKAFEEVKHSTDRVHFIISNAGVMAVRNFVLSEDGVESQFAACYLGHFLLTNLLVKAHITGQSGDTVVNVGSLGYQLAEANLDDINFQVGDPPKSRYRG